jgi:cation transport ATPase
MRIARQSIAVGLGLSAAAMLVAAAGYIPPAAGALLQEAIDVAVILNALRAAGEEGLIPAKESVHSGDRSLELVSPPGGVV